jgi:CRP-like cAMP-binding protein
MLLLDGLAFRQKVVRDGKRQIISIHIPGEFVDLQNNLLSDADHSVQSLSKVEAAVIPAVALNDLAASHPAVGRAMWMDTLIDSSIFREWVVNVGRRDATTRIAHLLCELIVRLRASGVGEGDSYRFPLTQEHLADCTGLTAVHTNRVLQKLRGLGMLSLTAKSLTVLDWPALKDTGEFNDRYLHHAA